MCAVLCWGRQRWISVASRTRADFQLLPTELAVVIGNATSLRNDQIVLMHWWIPVLLPAVQQQHRSCSVDALSCGEAVPRLRQVRQQCPVLLRGRQCRWVRRRWGCCRQHRSRFCFRLISCSRGAAGAATPLLHLPLSRAASHRGSLHSSGKRAQEQSLHSLSAAFTQGGGGYFPPVFSCLVLSFFFFFKSF